MAHSRRHPVAAFFLWLLVGLVVLALVAAGLALWTVQRSFPQTEGELTLTGLEKPVTVVRDAHGVPQITADTPTDLFMAQGYVQAQDRFWEMDFRRHVTSGRLAELFGESQVGTDAFIRTLGWRVVAEKEVEALDDTSRAYYEAYADGVNAYLDAHSGADISLEYAVLGLQNPGYSPEKWTPADSVAWLKAMAWDLRSNLEQEIDRALLSQSLSAKQIRQLYPEYPYDENPTIVTQPSVQFAAPAAESAGPAPADPSSSTLAAVAPQLADLKTLLASIPSLLGDAGSDIGSNSWVVSGEHTATGKPLLANDPHLGPAMPSVWYQMGLHCSAVTDACPFDVAGFTFSGLPGVVIGHNDSIAWGFTNLGPDVADLFVEKVTDESYELDGTQHPLETRKETISVAGGDDVPLTIRATGHGPLVSDLTEAFGTITASVGDADALGDGQSYALSLQWTALTPGNTARAVFAMNAATDWEQFRDAARLFDVPSQNLVYADVEGNIGYQAPGMIPVRSAGDGTHPMAGWTSANGWTGMIPFDDLPSTYNPPQGYIVTANNAAVGTDYPRLITKDWDAGYRAARITRLIADRIDAGEKLTAEDMSAIQADDRNAIAETLVPYLLDVEPNGNAITGRNLLQDWDFSDDADSAASAYFNIVWKTLLEQVFAPKLPESTPPVGSARWFHVVSELLPLDKSRWWADDAVSTRDGALVRALDSAWEEAVRLMGDDPSTWSWGQLHTLTIRNGSFGESGIGVIESIFNRGPYEVSGGSSVVNANGWDASQSYEVNWVPSMRQVIDVSDFDASTWVNLTGASGHAFHPHYVDQTPLWAENETLPWPFTADAIADAAEHTLVLEPGSRAPGS